MVFLREVLKFRVLFLSCILSLTGCSSLLYFPDHYIHFPPEKNGFTAMDVDFVAGDGTKLFGWFFKNSQGKTKGTLIQFHGNAENMSSHYATLVWATKKGYNLFTFDYRGYGKSEGVPNPEGTYKDGMSALDQAWELHQKFSPGTKFIVVGQSLGGVIAMRAFVDFRHQKQTALIVMDSTFSSYQRVAREKLASKWFLWPLQPLTYLLLSDRFASERVIPRVKTPMLVIHDVNDPVIDFENAVHIFRLHGGKKDLWTFDKGSHIGAFSVDSYENRTRFLSFLDALPN